MGGWRHNYMSGTHTAKFLLCHYLLTLMEGWGMGGWRHNYMSGTHTAKFLAINTQST
jgi:hypothetical protein